MAVAVQIFIMRHGQALDHHDRRVTHDAMRPLTPRGQEDTATMARMLTTLGVQPDRILCSPLVRTRETAELLAGALPVTPSVQVCDALSPAGSAPQVLDEILANGVPRVVVTIGHMPNVGRIAGYLAFADDEVIVPFSTSEVCCVDLPDDTPHPGYGVIRYLIPPRVASAMLARP